MRQLLSLSQIAKYDELRGYNEPVSTRSTIAEASESGPLPGPSVLWFRPYLEY